MRKFNVVMKTTDTLEVGQLLLNEDQSKMLEVTSINKVEYFEGQIVIVSGEAKELDKQNDNNSNLKISDKVLFIKIGANR